MDKPSSNDIRYSDIEWDKVTKEVLNFQRKIVVAYNAGEVQKVNKLQNTLVSSFAARAYAVRRVSGNSGAKTPGIDGATLATDADRINMIEKLKLKGGYTAKPVRRIYIPKANSIKKRPLGIPTIFDRCVQALYLLALEPIAEETGDQRSYGFRKGRSAQDVQRYLRQTLALDNRARYIMDGDIETFFDSISHDWILKNIPLDKRILVQWLVNGFIDFSGFHKSEMGVPQGGVISPVIANMVLDGMEKVILDARKELEKDLKRIEGKVVSSKINFVRYADDFIVTAANKQYFKLITEKLEVFLKERGVKLNMTKTKILTIDKGFDFLGFYFKKYATNSKKSKEILLIKPTKNNILKLKTKIKTIFKKNVDAVALISELNPVLRGWGNYYRFVNSKRIFTLMDTYVFENLIRWVKRIKGRKHITKKLPTYFKVEGDRKWNFQMERDGKIYRLFRMEQLEVGQHVIVKDKNPILKEYEDYFRERHIKTNYSPLVQKLIRIQENKCPVCLRCLATSDSEEESIEVHHVHPKSEGGSNKLDNLKLLHKTCHKSVTYCIDPVLIAKYRMRGIIPSV